MIPPTPLLDIRQLCTWFPITRGLFSRTTGHVKAVDDVSLQLAAGETVGLVGESGCGKTTLGRTLLGLERATSGEVHFRGDNLVGLSERQFVPHRRKLQMIFQDPYSSLNPRMTVLDIVTEGLVQHGLLEGTREEAAARLLGEVGLPAADLHRYPHEFSGGQRQRISIARALCLRPEFIVCDEAVSALDVSVQSQVINLLLELRARHGLTYLFISHDLAVVRQIAQRIAVMYLGRLVEVGDAEALIAQPLHPYTQALISAVPAPGSAKPERIVLSGDVPSPARPPPGCPFHPRCPHAMPRCRTERPLLRRLHDREIACHLHEPAAARTA
jgi:oligopeptide/dipeptide ABC transporter ATP-binding protein